MVLVLVLARFVAYLGKRMNSVCVCLSCDQASVSRLRMDKELFHQWLAYYLQRAHYVQTKLFVQYMAMAATVRTSRLKVVSQHTQPFVGDRRVFLWVDYRPNNSKVQHNKPRSSKTL